MYCMLVWWSGGSWRSAYVVSALASINEDNQRRARLLVSYWDGWPCPCSIPGAGHLFRYVTNHQPPRQTQPFIFPGWVNEDHLRLGRKKQVQRRYLSFNAFLLTRYTLCEWHHSVSGRTRGVQRKLWDPLRTRAIPERLRGVFTMRRYTNTHLPYLTLRSCSILRVD